MWRQVGSRYNLADDPETYNKYDTFNKYETQNCEHIVDSLEQISDRKCILISVRTEQGRASWIRDFVEMFSNVGGKEDKEIVVLKVLRFNMYPRKNNNHLKVSEIQDMGQKIR